MHIAGIDIGGTKIAVSLGTLEGKILSNEEIPTQRERPWQEGLQRTYALLDSLLQKHAIQDLQGIGISAPGPLSTKTGSLLNPPNLPGWHGAPLVKEISSRYQKPVLMNNDANAAALAEYEFGPYKKTSNLVYLTCSTGMGGGVIANGALIQGASDTAAEIGHAVLDKNGPPCPCGLSGCFEIYCGGAALAAQMQEEISKQKIPTKILDHAHHQTGNIDAACLIKALKENDPYAKQVWEDFIERLAQGIGMTLMHYNPEVLILGTIATHAQELLLDPLLKALPRFCWKEPLNACTIAPSTLENRSAFSALALAKQATRL